VFYNFLIGFEADGKTTKKLVVNHLDELRKKDYLKGQHGHPDKKDRP
jgi:hypothetical protein